MRFAGATGPMNARSDKLCLNMATHGFANLLYTRGEMFIAFGSQFARVRCKRRKRSLRDREQGRRHELASARSPSFGRQADY